VKGGDIMIIKIIDFLRSRFSSSVIKLGNEKNSNLAELGGDYCEDVC
jgi:hypothetical protein